MKETRGHGFSLHPTHGAGIAVRQNSFWVVRHDAFKLGCNVCNGLFPSDRLKLPRPFGAHAFQGLRQTFRAVGSLGIPRNFGAQHPLRVKVLGIALYLGGAPVFDSGKQSTRVRAVMRAQTFDNSIFFKGDGDHGLILKGDGSG